MTDHPDLAVFSATADAWLASHLPRRPPAAELAWGEGSDDVSLFKNLTIDQERAHLDEIRAWQRTKSDAGYGSISWPVEHGGAGLPGAYDAAFSRLEGQYLAPNGHEAVGITLDLVGPTILTCGTPEQGKDHLTRLRRLDDMWCQLFSEPGAGSDLASLSCRAVRDGDEWVLDGQKVWTSGAIHADWGYVLARTDSSGTKHAGITAFIFPMDTPGVEVRPLRQMSGGSSFNEVFFTGARFPSDAVLGEVGGGWQVAVTTLGFERAAATKSGSGGGDVFDRLVLAAQHFGRSEDPVVRQALACAYANGRVRSMTRRRTSAALKTGGVPGPEGSIGKLAWTEGLRELSELAGLILGLRLVADTGEWGTYAWSELVNGVPGFRVAGGSDEVQRNIIGERVLGLPR